MTASKHKGNQAYQGPLLAQPVVGTALSILAMLVFFFLLMILPLVGPAGASAPPLQPEHVQKNFIAFLSVLLISLALSVLASLSKLQRRRLEGGPLPYWPMSIVGVCTFLLVMLLLGLLKI